MQPSVTATAPAGSAGTVDVTVTTVGGTSTTGASDQYTYVAAPTVTSVSPASGPLTAGTVVTITGANLSGATAVKFGATSAASYTVNSATSISAVAPAGSAGTNDITVTTAGGGSTTSAADHYTFVALPAISGLSPATGSTNGGSSVTITGLNLSGATAVRFGANNAAGFTVNSATSITAQTAAAAAGPVDVTISTVGGTSVTAPSDRFTFAPPPAATNQTVSASSSSTAVLHVTTSASGGPFTGLYISSGPSSGTAIVRGLDLIYTPDPTITTAQTVTITYVVNSRYGSSTPATITITVTPKAQTVSQLDRLYVWPPPPPPGLFVFRDDSSFGGVA